MKTPLLNLSALCLALMATSCVTDVANRYYSNQRYPEKRAEEVQVLYEKPSRPFTVIADFQSRGANAESLRKQAAKIGADAVIVTTLGGYYNLGEEWAGNDRMGSTYSRITGSAIKYSP